MKSLRHLLRPFADGYPESYVAARLKPQLMTLYLKDSRARASTERYQAIAWSYRQLSQPLREEFAPIYLYLQLPVLLESIRYATAGMNQSAHQALSTSLWDKTVVKTLSSKQGMLQPVETLDVVLKDFGYCPLEIQESATHRLQQLEMSLYRFILSSPLSGRSDVKEIMLTLRDLYNLSWYLAHEDFSPQNMHLATGRLLAVDFANRAKLVRAVRYHYTRSRASTNLIHDISSAYSKKLFVLSRSNDFTTCLAAFLWQQTLYAALVAEEMPKQWMAA